MTVENTTVILEWNEQSLNSIPTRAIKIYKFVHKGIKFTSLLGQKITSILCKTSRVQKCRTASRSVRCSEEGLKTVGYLQSVLYNTFKVFHSYCNESWIDDKSLLARLGFYSTSPRQWKQSNGHLVLLHKRCLIFCLKISGDRYN